MQTVPGLLTLVTVAIILSGCAGTAPRSSSTWKPSEAEIKQVIEASYARAVQIQAFPADADMENFTQQMRLKEGGMYKTWTGEYKHLPDIFKERVEAAKRPGARYEKYTPGNFEALKVGSPVDVMK